MSEISREPQEINDNPSVGQEFIEWAEQYWRLKDMINLHGTDVFMGEKCDYNYMRNVFICKINNLIKSRLSI